MNKFDLPKFQGKVKAYLGGIFSTEKRTKFLQDYMNGLIQMNDAPRLKLLFTCTIFEDFIDLISKSLETLWHWFISVLGHSEIKRKLLKRLNEDRPL